MLSILISNSYLFEKIKYELKSSFEFEAIIYKFEKNEEERWKMARIFACESSGSGQFLKIRRPAFADKRCVKNGKKLKNGVAIMYS